MKAFAHVVRPLLLTAICACGAGEVSGLVDDDTDADNVTGDDGYVDTTDNGGDTGDDGDVAPAPDLTKFYGPTVTSGILNPFYTTGTWRLWTVDQTPVHYAGYNMGDPVLKEADFAPPLEASRKFPDETVNTYPAPYLALVSDSVGVAGSWDDVYATRDGAHSGLYHNSWADVFGNSIALRDQYIAVSFGTAQPFSILQLGVNFTSESLSNSGHQLVSNKFAIDYTERNFSFVNTVRATPGYLSYSEQIADRAVDSYDGLFSHAFNSVGRSSSEVRGLYKMLVAGAYMPRATKDLLKLHGAYALALLSVFRQTLPYTEADGATVSLGSEMLQRPAYLSNGAAPSLEFLPRNQIYHQYDEPQHMYRMIQAARAMTIAPPFAVVRLVGLTVENDGATLVENVVTDARIKSFNTTMARIWGNAGETLTLRVDVGDSYDLQGLEMKPLWQTVYPEQRNVTITHEEGTVWRIRVEHDPSLPKGRIPVALFVDNGTLKSGPAFVSFYWPEPGQVENPGYVYTVNPDSKTEVTKNLRPLFTTNLGKDWLHALPGETVAFDLSCDDPEGFPTRFYRWLGEAGQLSGTHFTFTPSASDPGLVYPVHLVCADGTGAYGGLLVRVAVTPDDGAIPPPWKTTVFGTPEASGSVHYSGGVFEIVGNGRDEGYIDHGRLVFEERAGDIETTARIVSLAVDGSTSASSARAGVTLREDLGDGARRVFAYAQGNQGSPTALSVGAQVRTTRLSSPGGKAGSPLVATSAAYVKAVRRDTVMAGLASSDGSTWEQLWSAEVSAPAVSVVSGFAVTNTDSTRGNTIGYARAKLEVVAAPVVSVPIAKLAGTLVAANTTNYDTSVNVTLIGGNASDTIRYTTDGSTPTGASALYSGPFDVTTAGDVMIKARAFAGGNSSGVTIIPVKITP